MKTTTMTVYQLGDDRPQVAEALFIASNAAVIGRVHLGHQSTVWWGATIRGDTELITVGAQSNVQDGAVIHADPGRPTTIGDRVTIGHGATIHGCRVDELALIGIGATVLNGAHIGAGSVIGAHALVPEGMEIPAGSLVMGVPARIKRPLSAEEKDHLALSAAAYVQLGERYTRELSIVTP